MIGYSLLLVNPVGLGIMSTIATVAKVLKSISAIIMSILDAYK